jgi:hypothetical protein
MEQRSHYRREVLAPKYLDVESRPLVEQEVVATLQDLVAQLDSGQLPDSGIQFHARCLSALKTLQQTLPLEVGIAEVTAKRHRGSGCGEPIRYSTRNASVGFTPEARCAGMSAAPSPAEQRTRMAIAMTAGSEGFTS